MKVLKYDEEDIHHVGDLVVLICIKLNVGDLIQKFFLGRKSIGVVLKTDVGKYEVTEVKWYVNDADLSPFVDPYCIEDLEVISKAKY